jgi:hypothetical protein
MARKRSPSGGGIGGSACDWIHAGAGCSSIFPVCLVRRLDIFDTMCGEEMLDKHTFLLHAPLPWARLGVTLTVMLGLVGRSMVLVEYGDF